MEGKEMTSIFSPSGKIWKLQAPNGRIIAEILVHGPLRAVVENAEEGKKILPGRANIFRGELFGLCPWEFLNVDLERIEEK